LRNGHAVLHPGPDSCELRPRDRGRSLRLEADRSSASRSNGAQTAGAEHNLAGGANSARGPAGRSGDPLAIITARLRLLLSAEQGLLRKVHPCAISKWDSVILASTWAARNRSASSVTLNTPGDPLGSVICKWQRDDILIGRLQELSTSLFIRPPGLTCLSWVPWRIEVKKRRDDFIGQHNALIWERDALIEQRNALIWERDALIEQRNAQIWDRNVLIGERDAAIAERDALFADHDASIQEARKPAESPGMPGRVLSDLELIGLLPVEFPRRAVVNGFPGAGNVLAERVCSALLKNAGLPIEQPRIRGWKKACDGGLAIQRAFGSRVSWLLSRLRSALPRDWAWESFLNHASMGSVVFVATHGSDFLLISGLDLNAYVNAAVHATHELPSRESYAFYAEQGFQVLPAVRHPLDTLVSFASKLDPASAERVRGAAATTGISPNETACRIRLASDTWLLDHTALLLRFYGPIAEMAGHDRLVRYEEALENPIRYVTTLARRLGVDVESGTVAEIASMIGHQEFAPGHFNRPAVGKWRQHLSERQLELLRPTGLFEIFAVFGYAEQYKMDIGREALQPSRPAEHLPILYSTIDALKNHQYLDLAGTFDPEELTKAVHLDGAVHTLRHGHHVLASSDGGLLREYAARLIDLLAGELGCGAQ
jgi:hypothetical protein